MLPPALRQLTEPSGVALNLMAWYMTEDQHGSVWLATANGLIRYDGHQPRALHAPGYSQDDSYGRPVLTPDGRLWARQAYGNKRNKLVYVETTGTHIVRVADTTRLAREFLTKFGISRLYVDRRGQLWISLPENGLLRVNPRTLAADHVLTDKLTINDLSEGPDGRFWLATERGLYTFDPQTRQTRRYPFEPDQASLPGNTPTFAVSVRPNGDVLVCRPNEVDIISSGNGHLRRIRLPVPNLTSTLWTNAFLSDGLGNDYFSVGRMVFRLTAGGALQRLEFTYPAEKVISLCVGRMHDPAHPRLWVSTITHTLYEYDLTRLRPVPSLNILDISVNGTRLVENEQQLETRFQRDTTGQPTLQVKEDDFVQLRFTPFVQQQSTTFRYKLEGYDHQWTTYGDTLGVATYQLPAGQYRFLFNRAVGNGGWAKQIANLSIRVQPPFWKTSWFLSIVVLLVGSGLVGLYRIALRRQKLQRELAHQEGEAANLRQLDELKDRFFANMTHELRTPITLLLNANEQLAHQPLDTQGRQLIAVVDRNANQLLRLITQLLDINRLDNGKLTLTYSLGDPIACVSQLVQAFDDLATTKQIQLTIQPDENGGNYWFDREKLEAIVDNLLSNALKFTPAGGRVSVATQRMNERLVVRVQDTGPGIPFEEQARIFERFYQTDASSTRAHGGTGIGLAFVRELTELMGGTIRVDSLVHEGSTFTLTLPLEAVREPVAQEITTAPDQRPIELASPSSLPKLSHLEKLPTEGNPLPVVLVVEDNEELRTYLVEQLSATYQVMAAVDGRDGLEQALATTPDLIVSDVMMPRMDGFALVGALKTDVRTSHIPVVLLSARSSHDSVLHGLNMGADAYVEKPFKLNTLQLRIRNAIQTRRNWQIALADVHSKLLFSDVNEDNVPEKEKRFLARLKHLLLDHLQDEQVNVDWLAAQVDLSRSQLHRKLTALTGQSTTRFIHRVRLEKAEELLSKGECNIAEVAYQVGYNSQSYFTRMFQEHFGYLPTQLKL
ncbi:hypothetical protein GCM10028825_14300 [Spirosoma agri]